MKIYGISYMVRILDNDRSMNEQEFDIHLSLVETQGELAFVSLPRTWKFSVPLADGFVIERFGASETYGLFGGVNNIRQKLFSEACERAVAEVLTVTLCKILSETNHDNTRVLILGIALPKIVGRFASLRPPSNVKIEWICPKPFPQWIAPQINEAHLRYYASMNADSLYIPNWEDEPLIVSLKTFDPASKPVTIQRFQLWDPPFSQFDFPYQWVKMDVESLVKGYLPREIAVAAGVVDLHKVKPFDTGKEVKWREVDESFCPRAAYKNPLEQRVSKDSIGQGWQLLWLPTNT